MYPTRKSRILIIGVLFLAVALFGCQPQYNSSVTGTSPALAPPTPPPTGYPGTGSTGSTLFLPDGSLALTLLHVEEQGSQVFFHFHAQSYSEQNFALIGSGVDYQFIIPRPNSDTPVQAASPLQSDFAAHPALPAVLVAQGSADGWLVVDTTTLGSVPQQIDYRFATVHSEKCTNPNDQSTCQPADLYRALLWNFSL